MLSELSKLSKYLGKEVAVRTTSGFFLIHSKMTVAILLTCTILISAKQYFGEPIQCLSEGKTDDYINTFCWTMGTFILSKCQNNILAEGVCPGEYAEGEKIYLRYYQWVVVILIMQSMAFYFPCFLWKIWETNRLQQICQDIGTAIIPDEVYSVKLKLLVKYFSSDFKDVHMCYTLKYIFCENLGFLINIINIFLMNIFFKDFWSTYIDALSMIPSYNWPEWNEKSSRVFPKIAKCEFRKYGFSQTLESRDILCILPLNILNEKIFAFFYFWFLLLAGLSFVNIIYRIVFLCSLKFRIHLIRTQAHFLTPSQIGIALRKLKFGDWFMLFKVSANINTLLFRDLLQELYNMQKRKENGTISYA